MSFKMIANLRDEQGRGASRRLRKDGRTPAIIYGADKAAVAVTLDHIEIFYSLKKPAFHSETIAIEINGQVESVKVCDFQMHPYKPEVLHVDFKRV